MRLTADLSIGYLTKWNARYQIVSLLVRYQEVLLLLFLEPLCLP